MKGSQIIKILTGGAWNPMYDIARIFIHRYKESGYITIFKNGNAIITKLRAPALKAAAFYEATHGIYDDASIYGTLYDMFDDPDAKYEIMWESDSITTKFPLYFKAGTNLLFKHSPNAKIGVNKELQISPIESWNSGRQNITPVNGKPSTDWFIRPLISFVFSPDQKEVWGPFVSSKLNWYLYKRTLDEDESGMYNLDIPVCDLSILNGESEGRSIIVDEVPSGDDRIHSHIYLRHKDVVKEFNVCQYFAVDGIAPRPSTVAGLIAFDAYHGRAKLYAEKYGSVVPACPENLQPYYDSCYAKAQEGCDYVVENVQSAVKSGDFVFEIDDSGYCKELSDFAKIIKKQAYADSLFTKLYCLEWDKDEKELYILKEGDKCDLYTCETHITDYNQSCAVHAAAASLLVNNTALLSNLGNVFALYYIYYALVYTDGLLTKGTSKTGNVILYPSGKSPTKLADFFANDVDEETSTYFTIIRKSNNEELCDKAYFYKMPNAQHYVCARPINRDGDAILIYDSVYKQTPGQIMHLGAPAGNMAVKAGVYDGNVMTVEGYGSIAKADMRIQSSLNYAGGVANV